MSKRPHNCLASASASEDLVNRLKAAANDVELLQEIIERNVSASVAAAFATLLSDGRPSEPSGSKLRKKVSLSNVREYNLCWVSKRLDSLVYEITSESSDLPDPA